jgi:hypothetical protein
MVREKAPPVPRFAQPFSIAFTAPVTTLRLILARIAEIQAIRMSPSAFHALDTELNLLRTADATLMTLLALPDKAGMGTATFMCNSLFLSEEEDK